MAIPNKTNNSEHQTIGLYTYQEAGVGDTVGDTRKGTISGWIQEETCTVANATKGGGTWIVTSAKKTISLVDNNEQYSGVVPTTAGAFISLASGGSGIGRIIIGNGQEYAQFSFIADGTVTLWTDKTANVVTTETNDKFCITDGGAVVYIINELGSTLVTTVEILYNS